MLPSCHRGARRHARLQARCWVRWSINMRVVPLVLGEILFTHSLSAKSGSFASAACFDVVVCFFCKRKHRVDYITFVSHTLHSSLKRSDNFSLAVSWWGEAIPPPLPTRSVEMRPSCVRCRHHPGCLQGSWELGQVLQRRGSVLTPGPAFSAAS